MCKRWIYPILLYCSVMYVSRCIFICFCTFPTVLYSTLFGVLYLYHRCVFPIVLFGAHLSLRSWIKYCGVLLFLLVCLPSVVCVFVLLLVCILFMHFSTFCTFTFSTFLLSFSSLWYAEYFSHGTLATMPCIAKLNY